MEAARAVAAFTADVHRVGAVGHEPGMAGRWKIFIHLGVAFGTILRAHEFGSGDVGRRDDQSIDRDA